MSKFKVHIYRVYREVYETDQGTVEAAMEDVVTNFRHMDCVQSEDADELTDWVLVDPILDDGEVDYEASEWRRWTNTEEAHEPLQKARKALKAIQARYMGVIYEDAFVRYGPLSYDRALDMNHIATSTLKEIE